MLHSLLGYRFPADCRGLGLRRTKKGQRGTRIQPSGRAFLQNKSDRSCIPLFGLGEFSKSIPPREAKELGDRHTLRKGDLRKGNLEVWEGI